MLKIEAAGAIEVWNLKSAISLIEGDALVQADAIQKIVQAKGLDCPPELASQVEGYLALLEKWNRKVNLTRLAGDLQRLERHFLESFEAARLLNADDGPLLDIGSGAGFPGLAIKLYRPELPVYLVEVRQKKAAFLETVRRELGLKEVTVINRELEQCTPADFPTPPQTITLRAVGTPEKWVEQGLSLCGPRVKIILFTTEPEQELLKKSLPRVAWQKSVPLPGSRQRLLLVGNFSL